MVQVIGTEVLSDINGREYNRATLRTMPTTEQWTNPNTGEVFQILAPAETTRVVGYRIPYLYDAHDESAISDYLWDARPGMVIKGKIVTRQVIPYTIDDKMRNSSTVFVQGSFDSSAEFETAVKMAFERSGRTLASQAVQVPTEPAEANTLGQLLDSTAGI